MRKLLIVGLAVISLGLVACDKGDNKISPSEAAAVTGQDHTIADQAADLSEAATDAMQDAAKKVQQKAGEAADQAKTVVNDNLVKN